MMAKIKGTPEFTMYLNNAWYAAGWDHHLDNGLLARLIKEET